MPAFARTTDHRSSPPRRAKSCGCGGKCGGCGSKKSDQRATPCSGGSRCHHDFARLAVGPRDQADVDGAAACNPETGVVDIEVKRESCAGEFTRKHEEMHRAYRTPCCERYSRCWHAAKSEDDKQACTNAYDTWIGDTKDWHECVVLEWEVAAIHDFLRLNCDNESNAPGIGAGIGAGVGAVGGGIGGAFAGQAIAQSAGSAMSSTAAGALGGVLGALGGAAVGALLGFAVGHIVKAAQKDDVPSGCCEHLREFELFGAEAAKKDTCPTTSQELPCPFDAEGKIITTPAPTATFNAPSASTKGEA